MSGKKMLLSEEHSQVMALGLYRTHFPDDVEYQKFLAAWAHYYEDKWGYPAFGNPSPTVDVELDMTHKGQVGFSGLCSVPFEEGLVLSGTKWGLMSYASLLESVGLVAPIHTKELMHWPDGTVRYLMIGPWSCPVKGKYRLATTSADPPPIDPATPLEIEINGAGAEWVVEEIIDLDVEVVQEVFTYPDGSSRSRITVLSLVPTGQESGQPDCAKYGTPGDRLIVLDFPGVQADQVMDWDVISAHQDVEVFIYDDGPAIKFTATLRPGEKYSLEIVRDAPSDDPVDCWASAEHYVNSKAFFEPLTLFDFGDELKKHGPTKEIYDLQVMAAINGIYDLSHGDGVPDDWKNPRDFGDIVADWDGDHPVNNEYEIPFGLGLQAFRMSGIENSRFSRGEADVLRSKAWKIMRAHASHHASVGIYHANMGPLQWMHNGPWPHAAHDHAGDEYRQRSVKESNGSGGAPNSAHWNGRDLLQTYLLTGNTQLLVAGKDLAWQASWKALSGPESPGYPNLTGEYRAPANLLGVINDALEFEEVWKGDDQDFLVDAADTIVQEASKAKPSAKTRYKPWMCALLVANMHRAAKLGVTNAENEVDSWRSELQMTGLADDGQGLHLMYQAGDPEDRDGSMWSVPGGSALVATTGEVPKIQIDFAAAVFEYGCRHPWYYRGSDIGEFTNALAHGALAAHGWALLEVLE